MKKWRCMICGYIHEGDNPPETCPVCGAPKEEFVLMEQDKEEENEKTKQLQAITTDVIIVGSGAAALTAAITARNSGLETIILQSRRDRSFDPKVLISITSIKS